MLNTLNELIWNGLVYILVPAGIIFTISSKFVQFRLFARMFKLITDKSDNDTGVSSFQALALSVGGRVGAGNIAGVAVAVALGGPGAVFWMWMVGLFGMATSLFECALAQLFKRSEKDQYRGGPAHYIVHGLGPQWRWLAGVYSVLLLASFGVAFVALQSFSIASSFQEAFAIPPFATGIFLAVTVGGAIFGGINRLVKVSEFVVPIMALLYLLLAAFVIVTNLTELPRVLGSIVANALGFEQVVSGGVGAAILLGVKRGLFSNEAGLGSAPNVAATAEVKHPMDQGLVQALSVFIDTLILCTCTAMVILLSDIYQPGLESGGITMTQQALNEHIGGMAGMFVSIILFLFGFSSILYNYYMGENAIDFFTGQNKHAFNLLRVVTITLVIWASLQDLSTVLGFADTTMGMLALVNLFALVLLFKPGLKLVRDYDQQLKGGAVPRLRARDYSDFDIDRSVWKDD
ncbi:MAG: alanine/glycine:cation symporter family protein [Exilibacterium sp.]